MGGFGQGRQDKLYNQQSKGGGTETLRPSWRRLIEAEDRLGRKRKTFFTNRAATCEGEGVEETSCGHVEPVWSKRDLRCGGFTYMQYQVTLSWLLTARLPSPLRLCSTFKNFYSRTSATKWQSETLCALIMAGWLDGIGTSSTTGAGQVSLIVNLS